MVHLAHDVILFTVLGPRMIFSRRQNIYSIMSEKVLLDFQAKLLDPVFGQSSSLPGIPAAQKLLLDF